MALLPGAFSPRYIIKHLDDLNSSWSATVLKLAVTHTGQGIFTDVPALYV